MAGSAAAEPPARDSGAGAKAPPPPAKAIDFTVEGADGEPGERYTAPPPDIQHPPLTPDRYRGIPAPAAEDPIDDPLAEPPAAGAAPAERSLWLGVRLGGGVFDDGAAPSARPGFALGIAGRRRLTGAVFAAARADWSRRGGDAMTGTGMTSAAIDVLGASAGAGIALAGAPIALIGQLRADLRLASARASAPVHRAGLGIAAGAELALPATPFTVGLRLEQGLTELVPGARDRAVLVELGVDLR